jgi:gamma-D-glutamyl-L-lysine dipeptidyl-peptidase
MIGPASTLRARSMPWLVLLVAALAAACATPRAGPAPAPAPAGTIASAATPATTATTAAATTAADPLVAFADSAIAGVRVRFAPDRRTARFDVQARRDGTVLVVTGETTDTVAHAAFVAALGARGVAWRDEVLLLPDPALGERTWALANNSVSNLRTTPGHSSELSTQVLLGTPLRVLRRQDGFYLVRTPEGYLSWVDTDGIVLVDEARLRAHRAAPKIIYLRAAGTAYSRPIDGAAHDVEPTADLVLGALLELDDTPDRSAAVAPAAGPADGFHRARMPDGRSAYVRRDEAAAFDGWVAGLRATEQSLVATARTLMGAPYLWGGTSAKGMDCSGFTKTVYLMHGLILPRDASQQVHVGTLVDDRGDFSGLRPGDLLFFGRRASAAGPERVVHVAMWIGDGRFIHASGRVRIDSMDPSAQDYDAYNHGRYLRTMRVPGTAHGLKTLQHHGLYAF